MAGYWPSNNHKMNNSRALKDNDVLKGGLLSPKSGIDLMQNCDLPPPLKVFSGPDKTVVSSMNRVFNMIGREDVSDDFDVYRGGGGGGGGGENNEKLELLKALRLSQTRAREAERKAAKLVKERDCVANALWHESLQLYAYRQWVKLLEVQVLKAQVLWQQQGNKFCRCGRSKNLEEEEGSEDGSRESWIVALTFCLGIVGLGIAFGFCSWF